MLCLMFECEVRGVLATGGVAWSDREIAATIPGETSQILSCLDELLRKGVAHRNGEGAIHNRRMVHDENIRKIHAEAGKKGGNPLLVNQTANQTANQTPNQNPTPSPSSSSSTTKQKQKPIAPSDKKTIATEPHPVLVFPALQAQYGLPVMIFETFQESYPGIDVMAELHKARAWLVTNPSHRKTLKGMPKFLNSWLARSQNGARITGGNHAASGANHANKAQARTNGNIEAARGALEAMLGPDGDPGRDAP